MIMYLTSVPVFVRVSQRGRACRTSVDGGEDLLRELAHTMMELRNLSRLYASWRPRNNSLRSPKASELGKPEIEHSGQGQEPEGPGDA